MVSKRIINKKKCICGGNLKKQINFGELPIINNFKKTKTSKYPTVVTQCKNVSGQDRMGLPHRFGAS